MTPAMAKADALAAQVLTPEENETIDQAVMLIRAGDDPHLVLRFLYAMARLEGMLAIAKVGQ